MSSRRHHPAPHRGLLEVIGTVAFAISGVPITSREGYSVVGALVLAALPAVGGGTLLFVSSPPRRA